MFRTFWSIVLPSPSPRGLGQLVSVSEPEGVVGGGGGLALLTVAGLAGRLFCFPRLWRRSLRTVCVVLPVDDEEGCCCGEVAPAGGINLPLRALCPQSVAVEATRSCLAASLGSCRIPPLWRRRRSGSLCCWDYGNRPNVATSLRNLGRL